MIYDISYIIYHISYIIYHILYIMYHISYIIYHISYIIYHISCIIYHISYIIYHMFLPSRQICVYISQISEPQFIMSRLTECCASPCPDFPRTQAQAVPIRHLLTTIQIPVLTECTHMYIYTSVYTCIHLLSTIQISVLTVHTCIHLSIHLDTPAYKKSNTYQVLNTYYVLCQIKIFKLQIIFKYLPQLSQIHISISS